METLKDFLIRSTITIGLAAWLLTIYLGLAATIPVIYFIVYSVLT